MILWGLPLLLLLGLVVGDLRGGAPTHHPGRALLSIWLLGVLAAVVTLAAALRGASRPARLLTVPLMPLGIWAAQTVALAPGGFVDRHAEEALGRFLAKQASGQTVVLATPDYGYLAVQAAAGTPNRFLVTDRHDPRDPTVSVPPQLRALDRLGQSDAHWLVAPSEWDLRPLRQVQSAGTLAVFQKP